MLTIYKASAGSGKTFNLAYEYLKMLLGYKDNAGHYHLYTHNDSGGAHRHRHILAITFTNAATEEMKSRIVMQLNNLRLPDSATSTPYTAMLCNEFGCSAEQLQTAAEAALHDLLFDYDAFNVSTIDSFFQGVMRTFSRELDRQGDYELAIDNKDVIAGAITRMLDQLNYDHSPLNAPLYKWIEEYSLEKLVNGEQSNFFNRSSGMLRSLVKEMERASDETFAMHASEMRQYFARPQLFSNFVNFLNDKVKHGSECAATAQRIFDILSNAGIGHNIIAGPLLSRLMMAVDPPKKIPSDALTPKFLYAQELELKHITKKDNLKNPAVAAAADEILPLAQLFCSQFVDFISERKVAEALLRSVGYQIFISMAQRSLDDFLRENNTVMLSSTGELLKQIINEEEMPFIYERMGMQLEHLLIDEFQDTSRLQWNNLKPLVANSLANDFDNLIIGDEKQSIYRWRNSDSELLGSHVQTVDFPSQYVARGHNPKDNTNHRSAGDIVRFNNTLFKLLGCRYQASHYRNVVQTPSDSLASVPAFVHVDFNTDRAKEDIYEQTCSEILRQHADGYSWRDILVLVRINQDATDIVKYITEKHPEIRLISSEALLLKNSPAVRAVVSMLKLISRSYKGKKVTRDDDSTQYATKADIVLMVMRFNHYLSLGEEPSEALELALDEGVDAGKKLTDQIRDIKAENPANLVALVEAVIAHKLSPQQRREEYAYIAALQDIVMAHAEGPEPSLSKFLTEYDLNENRWAIKAPAHLDAVQVMTVHTAKGLERACVHIPVADWTVKDEVKMWVKLTDKPYFKDTTPPPILHLSVTSKSPLRNEKYSPVAQEVEQAKKAEQIDNLNITYVAYTRASRELHITFNTTKGMGGDVLAAVKESNDASGPHTLGLAQFFDPLTNIFALGSPTKPLQKAPPASNVVEAGEYGVDFRSDIRPLVSIDDMLGDSMDIGGEIDPEIVDNTFGGTEAMRLASRRGMDLHAILAGARTIDDIERSLQRFCSRTGLDSTVADDYRAELTAAIAANADLVKQWFSPDCKVFPERSIYDSSTGETFRPDRIVLTPEGECIVVDYKFTTAPRPSHKWQIENYARLLKELGYTKIRTYIWYPLLRKVE